MAASDDMITGWFDTGIGRLLEIDGDFLQRFAFVLVSSIDSSADALGIANHYGICDRYPECSILGGDLVVPGRQIREIGQQFNLFNGFDELWCFDERPTAGRPADLSIEAPLNLADDEPPEALVPWMKASKCHLGLGDGIGMNYATFDRAVVSYLNDILKGSNETRTGSGARAVLSLGPTPCGDHSAYVICDYNRLADSKEELRIVELIAAMRAYATGSISVAKAHASELLAGGTIRLTFNAAAERDAFEEIAGKLGVSPVESPGRLMVMQGPHGAKADQAKQLENVARDLFAVSYSCEEALKCVDSSLDLNPQMYSALILRAHILTCLDRHGDALDTIDAAIELNPNDPEGYAERAQVLCDVGNYETAEPLARRALEMYDANVVPSEVQLQAIYIALTEAVAAQGRIEEARELLREAEARGAGDFRVE